MKRINNFHFTEGNVYMFSGSPFDCFACGLYDRTEKGRLKLEALWYGGKILLFNYYLPAYFKYVRRAKSNEIRDFCFVYGYRCCETELHRS